MTRTEVAGGDGDWRPGPRLPSRLDSSRTKLVYLYLGAVDGASVAEIQRALGMGALTLYPVLGVLTDYGLVERDGDTYVLTEGVA